jgi:uncharacterized repeat protein (TIGR01451 family)
LVKKAFILAWCMAMLVAMAVLLQPGAQVGEANNDALMVFGQENNIEQIGPEWLDTNWNYRMPIVINNSSGETLTDYQVLIRLDDSNFDFSKANPGGSDVRFTGNDGETELDYWIESWNSSLAYIWVRVPSLEAGNNTIYMYYGNTGASSTSNGTATFIFFDDDWSHITSNCSIPGSKWWIRNGIPQVSAGELSLHNGTGISTCNSYLNKTIGFRVNYYIDLNSTSGHGYEWGGFIDGADGPRTVIRDRDPSSDPSNLYLLNRVNFDDPYPLGNSWRNNYHVFEIRWQQGESTANIDHTTIVSSNSSEVPFEELPVTFYSYLNTDTLWVDWVYMRNYTDQEPGMTFGTEQGLADLKMSMSDFPDPVYAGEALTYQLTVTNTSQIAAPGVVVTETLPAEVNFVSANPSVCTGSSQLICNLGSINHEQSANVTLVVDTTIDGVITNTAEVGSLAYDPDLETNIAQITTTVTASADMSTTLQADPEVVKPEALITYDLTVTNLGPSTVPTASAVLTLPVGIAFYSAPSNICNAINGIVTCTLSDVHSGTSTQILIKGTVQATSSMNLQTMASVDTTTYDPNPANNISTEEIYVDAEPPVVNWVNPVSNGEIFIISKRTVTLTASATDNNKIDEVVFKLWDHFIPPHGYYVPIGTVTTEPYQVNWDTSELKFGELYQVYVEAYDVAKNMSRQRIFVIKENMIFLPLIIGK